MKTDEVKVEEQALGNAPASVAEELFHVVINDEEQYSLWPADGIVPAGWRVVGASDTREACLAYIEAHWKDMRPKSLRDSMGRAG